MNSAMAITLASKVHFASGRTQPSMVNQRCGTNACREDDESGALARAPRFSIYTRY